MHVARGRSVKVLLNDKRCLVVPCKLSLQQLSARVHLLLGAEGTSEVTCSEPATVKVQRMQFPRLGLGCGVMARTRLRTLGLASGSI